MPKPADHEQEFPACGESDRISNVAYKTIVERIISPREPNLNKERKRTKKKELWKGTLVETAAAEEIE
jgi:hypothetical protein